MAYVDKLKQCMAGITFTTKNLQQFAKHPSLTKPRKLTSASMKQHSPLSKASMRLPSTPAKN